MPALRPPVSPQCLRRPSLIVCPRSGQCGTQEGTCTEVWELGLQSGGTLKPPLNQAIHWPALPPPHTHTKAGLQRHHCLQFHYGPGGGALLVEPVLLGSAGGGGVGHARQGSSE